MARPPAFITYSKAGGEVTTSAAGVGGIAGNELLDGELGQGVSLDGGGGLDAFHGTVGPARAAPALVLDGRHLAFVSPIEVGGRAGRHTSERRGGLEDGVALVLSLNSGLVGEVLGGELLGGEVAELGDAEDGVLDLRVHLHNLLEAVHEPLQSKRLFAGRVLLVVLGLEGLEGFLDEQVGGTLGESGGIADQGDEEDDLVEHVFECFAFRR